MLSPQELASWAHEKSAADGPFTVPEERLFVMIDLVRRYHYHVLSPDIELACRDRAGVSLESEI